MLAVSSAAAAGADGKGDDVVVRLKLPAAELDALERSGVDVWHRAPAAPRAGGDAASSTERTLIADVHVPASRLNESLFAGAEVRGLPSRRTTTPAGCVALDRVRE